MTDRLGAFATATEMLAGLRARRVSAVELLDLHRRRIVCSGVAPAPPWSAAATATVA